MKRLAAALLLSFALAATLVAAQAPSSKPLDIYVVDTEGGKAALFVSPTGQSLLIDSGNPGGRDTDRIMEVVNQAGLKQIDFLISTHYHGDHVGGLTELVKRIPVGTFIDHGPSVEPKEQVQGFQAAYGELYAKAKHMVAKPGDKVPITGLDWRIVTSAGKALKTPLPGGGKPNPECAKFTPKEMSNEDDNGQSVGSVVTLGQFRLVDLGDLLWNREQELMCPNNPIGTVDLYLVTHHGLDQSGSPVLVHALQPRVAVMQNGTRKGAGTQAMPTMRTSPGLEDIWMLHWSYGAGIEQNSAGVFIANVEDNATIAGILTSPAGQGGPGRGGPAPAAGSAASPTPVATPQAQPPQQGAGRGNAPAAHSPAYYIKISARPDGSFTVTNSRNGFSKTYAARPRAR
jgi:competence protein ComEC